MRISDWSSDVCSSDLRKLQVIVWQSFRVISSDDFAIHPRGVEDLALWLTNNARRLSESQMVDGRQFITAVDKLVDLRTKTTGCSCPLKAIFSMNRASRRRARKSDRSGKSVSELVDLGGGRSIKNKNQ